MTDMKQNAVWSWVLRLLHAALALSVMILLLSGLLLNSDLLPAEHPLAQLVRQDWHLSAGYVLVVVLVVRGLYLVGDTGAGGFSAWIRPNWGHVHQVFKFYVTWGRSDLPAYFAHNPFWAPLYLLLFVLLLVASVTGLLLELQPLRALFGASKQELLVWHQALLQPVLIWSILHFVTVIAHELKGKGGDVSAMIHGLRIFHIRKPEMPTGAMSQGDASYGVVDVGKISRKPPQQDE